MDSYLPQQNAVAAIRVSSLKQGFQGDSPEAQKEQIERFAKSRNIHISKFFIFMESASKEEQPVQEAIDYCKNPKNNIQQFIIKSIDRFTRGGSFFYEDMKTQLVKYGVRLVDIYGIIGAQDVNTLEHLGVKYNWSVYSPTKKSEILEAERAKDEMRDIMSRMIGAEIRYVRLGYRVRTAPFGYKNEKVESGHGRRVILIPDPEESKFVLKMFELRIRGSLTDEQIVKELNEIGFKSRIYLKRDPRDRTKILGRKGGKKLTVKQFHDYIQNTIYAGVNREKWTDGEAIKCKFDGLVSIDTFNKANKGKIMIADENGEVKVYKDKPLDWQLVKQVNNPSFPYKKFVLCPECRNPLLGSASRGKLGKYYPAYHCARNHKGFRVPQKEFDQTIIDFVKNLRITDKGIKDLKEIVLAEWNKRIASNQKDLSGLENQILELKTQSKMVAEKIPVLTSTVAIKMLEDQLESIETKIVKLKEAKQEKDQEVISMDLVLDVVGDFMEHLEILLFQGSDPLKSAEYFSLLFDELPTYHELKYGTPKLASYINLITTLNSQNLSWHLRRDSNPRPKR
jgi:DNA invertase Pin-like site-specific DNA recombinase